MLTLDTLADHTRYLALGCREKHDTSFFDDCCHPLLSTESLSDRKAYCTPSDAAASSASAYTESATASASADADASTQYGEATSSIASLVSSIESTLTATATASIAIAVQEYAQQTSMTSTSQAAATTKASAPSGDVHTGGHSTWFTQNGQAGECGTVHSDSDYIVAINSNGYWQDYESNDNSPYCYKYIEITNTDNGRTVKAQVADVCPTCDGTQSLDMSTGLFEALGDSLSVGEFPISWWFV